MGFFDLFKTYNIDESLKEFETSDNALLIDVREKDEYKSGHIPQAINLPLSQIDKVEKKITDKTKKLFVYCVSGGRSSDACRYLKSKGYENVENIGGIIDYSGEVE